MKKFLFFSASMVAGFCLTAQEKPFLNDPYLYIENPSIYELNQEEGHTIVVPYSSAAEAIRNNRNDSRWYLCLNGTWKFHLADRPEETPEYFFRTGFNDSKWDTIHVPSDWEMQGFGDPLFRNVSTPFKPDPPHVPRDYNPTGSYRKVFNLPQAWEDRQIFLRMEKTASAAFVWINGKQVGYNEGAQEPAEYDITDFVRPGKNTIAVNVYKYSDGYYLEDQDYWRLAGIFDDVWLCASPGIRIFDWHATTEFDDDYRNAVLHLGVTLKNHNQVRGDGLSVAATLYDAEKKKVWELRSQQLSLDPGSSRSLTMSSFISEPLKWSAEFPCLYTIVLELRNEEGGNVETVSGRIGFRETEIRNQVFYLNGAPVKLNGINSHMQHPVMGHTMNEETT